MGAEFCSHAGAQFKVASENDFTGLILGLQILLLREEFGPVSFSEGFGEGSGN